MASPPRMLLLIDENVPRSVGRFLEARGHDVRLVQELFPGGTPDPVIATLGDKLSAIVVSWDRDFEALVSRIPKGGQSRFRRLGRISFKCNEVRGVALLERWIDYIEFHYERVRSSGEGRMILQIQESGLKMM